jgi:hypothetical protein
VNRKSTILNMLSRSESFLLPGGLGYIGSVTCVELYKFLAEEGIKRNIQYKVLKFGDRRSL